MAKKLKPITDKMRMEELESRGAMLYSPEPSSWHYKAIGRIGGGGSTARQAIDSVIRAERKEK